MGTEEPCLRWEDLRPPAAALQRQQDPWLQPSTPAAPTATPNWTNGTFQKERLGQEKGGGVGGICGTTAPAWNWCLIWSVPESTQLA